MSTETHPQVAEVMRQTQQIQSMVDEEAHNLRAQTFRGTDEANTVRVTVDGRQWLTGLHIEDGLLRLGAETVAQRVNEAMREAQALATAAVETQQERFMESLAGFADSLEEAMRPVRDTMPATGTESR